jgi:hypothetical protein
MPEVELLGIFARRRRVVGAHEAEQGDRVGVLVDRAFVECVDFCGLTKPARIGDVVSDLVELAERPAGQKYTGPLLGECPRDRAADRTTRSLDDGILAFRQHHRSPLSLEVPARLKSRASADAR